MQHLSRPASGTDTPRTCGRAHLPANLLDGLLPAFALACLAGCSMVAARWGGVPSVLIWVLAPLGSILGVATLVTAVLSMFTRSSLAAGMSEEERSTTVPRLLAAFLALGVLSEGLTGMLGPYASPELQDRSRHVEWDLPTEGPHAPATVIVVDRQGSIYLMSRSIPRVQKYDASGRFVCGWFIRSVKAPTFGLGPDDRVYVFCGGLGWDAYDGAGNLQVRVTDRETPAPAGTRSAGTRFVDAAGREYELGLGRNYRTITVTDSESGSRRVVRVAVGAHTAFTTVVLLFLLSGGIALVRFLKIRWRKLRRGSS